MILRYDEFSFILENPKFKEFSWSSFLSEANMFCSRGTLADLLERDLWFALSRFNDSEEFEPYILDTSDTFSKSLVGPNIKEFLWLLAEDRSPSNNSELLWQKLPKLPDTAIFLFPRPRPLSLPLPLPLSMLLVGMDNYFLH